MRLSAKSLTCSAQTHVTFRSARKSPWVDLARGSVVTLPFKQLLRLGERLSQRAQAAARLKVALEVVPV
jgi:hypothetical protein